MNLFMTLVVIAILIVVAAVLFGLSLWLEWTWWPYEFLTKKVSGEGPLETGATSEGDHLVLTIHNRGRNKIRLAAIEGRDSGGTRVFPTPGLDGTTASGATDDAAAAFKALSRVVLDADESRTVRLRQDELTELDCRELVVLDTAGRSWPVAQ